MAWVHLDVTELSGLTNAAVDLGIYFNEFGLFFVYVWSYV